MIYGHLSSFFTFVVNDVFQGVPLLVVFDADSATGLIFNRKLEGDVLSLRRVQPSEKGGPFLVDDTTGSAWHGLAGRAVKGNLKGKKLESLPSTPSFWFGWVDHYPQTAVFLHRR